MMKIVGNRTHPLKLHRYADKICQLIQLGYEQVLRRRTFSHDTKLSFLNSSMRHEKCRHSSLYSRSNALPISSSVSPHFEFDLELDKLISQQFNTSCLPNHRNVSMPDIGTEVENYLGSEKFSMKSSLSSVFENFNNTITLCALKSCNSRNHPMTYLTKCLEADHKYISEGGPNPFPLWRKLMIYLAADIFGVTATITEGTADMKQSTKDKHHLLGKIVEIAYITEQIHKFIVNVGESQGPQSLLRNYEFPKQRLHTHEANKAATLIGDLLWAQMCIHIAALKSQKVSALLSGFLLDYCESEYIYGVPPNLRREYSLKQWIYKTELGLGSVMGNVLHGMLYFSGHNDEIQKIGSRLGSLMGLTYQAFEDIKFFEDRDALYPSNWIDHGLLPVVCKVQKEPDLLFSSPLVIYDKVKSDKLVLAESRQTLAVLKNETLSYLDKIQNFQYTSKSRDLLTLFIQSLTL